MRKHLVKAIILTFLLVASANATPPSSQIEIEPNNSIGTANEVLLLQESDGLTASGFITGDGRPAAGDVDLFAITLTKPGKIFAIVDTGFPKISGFTQDSLLTLINSDGSTVIESDDDDASGNGDQIPFTATQTRNATITGASLNGSGRYFFRVESYDPAFALSSYRLKILVYYGSSVSELEPQNDLPASAPEVISKCDSGVLISGDYASGSDVDYYAFEAKAGDLVCGAIDGNPQRVSGRGVEPQFTFFGSDGVTNLLNPSAMPGMASAFNTIPGIPSANGPAGEMGCFVSNVSGKLYLRTSRAAVAVANAPYRGLLVVIRIEPKCGDGDGDSITDDSDNCPLLSNPSQADSDSDGVGDICDNCSTTSNASQVDSDGDGRGDVCEQCPTDPAKTESGACGCNLADADSNANSIFDCRYTAEFASRLTILRGKLGKVDYKTRAKKTQKTLRKDLSKSFSDIRNYFSTQSVKLQVVDNKYLLTKKWSAAVKLVQTTLKLKQKSFSKDKKAALKALKEIQAKLKP